MFDIGWTEMLIVAIITVLFVGPRELPAMLRTFAHFIKNIKSMAFEFQNQFSRALHESEISELKNAMNEPIKIDEKIDETKKQTPQEIEAEIAKNHAKAQKSKGINKPSGKNAVPGFSND